MDERAPAPRPTDELGEAACREHLRSARNGYLATTERALPIIVPVAIAADGANVVLTPLFDGSFGQLATRDPGGVVVALAVGAVDRWCVVAQGLLRRLPADGASSRCSFEPEVVTGWRHADAGRPMTERPMTEAGGENG